MADAARLKALEDELMAVAGTLDALTRESKQNGTVDGKDTLPLPRNVRFRESILPGSGYSHHALPELAFPSFGGENPRSWIRKCNSYFKIYQIPDIHKVNLASFHLEGRAEIWFAGYEMNKGVIPWKEFSADILNRFDGRDSSNVLTRFRKLRQQGSVESYIDQFDELMLVMLELYPLPEVHFVWSFINGLDEKIKFMVEMFQPATLSRAYKLARIQEQCILAVLEKEKNPEPDCSKCLEFQHSKYVTYAGELRFCEECRENLTLVYQCNSKQEKGLEDQRGLQVDGIAEDIDHAEGMEIPVSATIGKSAPDHGFTVKGKANNRSLLILIATGSEVSMLSKRAVRKLDCEVEETRPAEVIAVADGSQTLCDETCYFAWEMQGQMYKFKFRMMNFLKYDMVLGADWVRTVGTVEFNLTNMTMSFRMGGKEIVLQGETEVEASSDGTEECYLFATRVVS